MKSKQTPIKKKKTQEHPEPTIKRSLLFSQNCSFQLKSNPQRNFTERVSSSITYTQIRKKRVANREEEKNILPFKPREDVSVGVWCVWYFYDKTDNAKAKGRR